MTRLTNYGYEEAREDDLELDEPCRVTLPSLVRDVPVMRTRGTGYDTTDRVAQEATCEADGLQVANGFLAVDDKYAESVGLPESQRWPWSDSKGVYILASSYELHCGQVLRQITNQAYDKTKLTWSYDYAMHCLNILRETVICNADDEPLYTGPLHTQANISDPQPGVGFNRTCRDWNKLQGWARERSACWQPLNVFDKSVPEAERYKFCPDGSTPWKQGPGSM